MHRSPEIVCHLHTVRLIFFFFKFEQVTINIDLLYYIYILDFRGQNIRKGQDNPFERCFSSLGVSKRSTHSCGHICCGKVEACRLCSH